MRTSIFKHSLITAGVIAAMGITTNAIAIESERTTTEVTIKNIATANFSVAGVTQNTVESNEVTIRVSEQVSFSLVSDNEDGSAGNDSNVEEKVAPNGFAVFRHTLTNTGNRQDTYTINLTEPDPEYNPEESTVSYTIYNEDGSENRSLADVPYATANGQEFPLEKGQYIKFTISAKITGNKGGSTQDLQISATSQVLADNPNVQDATLTNTDSSFTRLPTFGIVKTITNALDLNDANDTATYKVVINNDGNTAFSDDATDIIITDTLPDGLVLAEALTASDIVVTGQATKGTIDGNSAGDDSFNITGVNIPIGQRITITFRVRQGGTGALNPATAINHVKVTDDLDDNADTENTLIDSTDSNVENVNTFYPTDDVDNVNGETPAAAGDDSTVPLRTIKRNLTLTNPTTREIAPTSGTAGRVTHQTIITNDGQGFEGDEAGELTFTITDDDGNTPDALNVVTDTVTITYDADGVGGNEPGQPIAISPTLIDGVNVYDINTALPNGIAPNGTVTISYEVSSDEAALDTTEQTTVTLKPADEGAPAQSTVEDTTTVKGLTLVKSQALDTDCDDTADAAFSSSADPLAALPGQCVIYQVAAFNTSSAATGFDITGLTISDLLSNFSDNADYRVDSAETTVSANNEIGSEAALNGDAISTTITTLVPQGTATMQFAVKIKTDRQ